MNYMHVEISQAHSSKHAHKPCGDIVFHERTAQATTIILCDGIGSGLRANLAANMCISRIVELLHNGFSVRQAFTRVVKSMEEMRQQDEVYPYAVFSIAHILNDGVTTVLHYETPSPIIIAGRQAGILARQNITIGQAIVSQEHCVLAQGEGLLLLSDGITQAGLGLGMAEGWGVEGVRKFVNAQLRKGRRLDEIPKLVHAKARTYWAGIHGDDCTAVIANCRAGNTVNIFTGPPSARSKDAQAVKLFMHAPGQKVVCGGSSAAVVAKQYGRKLTVEEPDDITIAPPQYFIDGVDLVTEGAVTLNQVYNIIDEDPANYEETSGVTKLAELLRQADRVNLFQGLAENPANSSITFRQQGIIGRKNILPLLAKKLQAAGKLVTTKTF